MSIRPLLLAVSFLSLVSPAFAQLSVSTKTASQLIGLESTERIGKAVFVRSDAQISVQPVVIVEAETEAANVVFDASDAQRVPVEFDQLTPKIIAIRAPGKTWVDCTVLDFEKNLYSRKLVIVELGPGPGPTPPGPTPPGPNPPEPGPFDNLSIRVSQQTANMSSADKTAIANACKEVADKMRRFEFRRLEQARYLLTEKWPKSDEANALLDFLAAENDRRILGWEQAQEYYLAIAKGLE